MLNGLWIFTRLLQQRTENLCSSSLLMQRQRSTKKPLRWHFWYLSIFGNLLLFLWITFASHLFVMVHRCKYNKHNLLLSRCLELHGFTEWMLRWSYTCHMYSWLSTNAVTVTCYKHCNQNQVVEMFCINNMLWFYFIRTEMYVR